MLQVKLLHLLQSYAVLFHIFSKTLISLVSQKGVVVIILIGDLQKLWFYFTVLKAYHGI